MRTLFTAMLVLMVLPVIADAQRRQRGEPDANWKEIDRFAKSTTPLTVRDVEALSGVKLLVDARKKLKLSDEQSTQLQGLMAKEKEDNESSLKAVDSLRKAARGRQTAMTEEEQTRMLIARAELRGVIDSVRARYRGSLELAMPLLDEAQRNAAVPLLEKHREESASMLRAKFAEMNKPPPAATVNAGARRRP